MNIIIDKIKYKSPRITNSQSSHIYTIDRLLLYDGKLIY